MKTHLQELFSLFTSLKSKKEVEDFLQDLLTPKELDQISERWQIIKRLEAGQTQRQISKELGVGIMTVTRGAAILKKGTGGFKKMIKRTS